MSEDKLKDMNEIKDIQEENTDHSDSYMVGLYNGMEFMIAIAEGRAPLFKSVAKDNKEDHITEQLTMDLYKDPVAAEKEEPTVIEQIKQIYFG